MTRAPRSLTPALRGKAKSTLAEIDSATQKIEKLTDVSRKDIEDVARKYSGEKSSVLVAIVGAAFGSVGGIGVTTALGVTALLTGPIGMVVGAALAVLLWRQTGHAQVERATDRLQIALGEIVTRLKTLPKGAPPEVRQRLWKGYEDLIDRYCKVVEPLIGHTVVQSDERAITVGHPQLSASAGAGQGQPLRACQPDASSEIVR